MPSREETEGAVKLLLFTTIFTHAMPGQESPQEEDSQLKQVTNKGAFPCFTATRVWSLADTTE